MNLIPVSSCSFIKEGVLFSGMNTKFTYGFTLDELKLIRDNIKSYEFVIQDLGTMENTIYEWSDQYVFNPYQNECNFCKSRYNVYTQYDRYTSSFTEEQIQKIRNNTKGYVVCLKYYGCKIKQEELRMRI